MGDVEIRRALPGDEPRWRALWAGYIDFYRGAVTEEATARTWAAMLSADGPVGGIVAAQDGEAIGLCHYVIHASTWSTQPICYLQDLYVDPQRRGGGAAKKLILACEEVAREKGCFRLYWQTQEYNAPARSLYDTIVPRSSFIVYRKNL